MSHFRYHTTVGPAHSTLLAKETCRACLSLSVTAGFVETDLYSAMALLTLHRLPSISTAPVSSPIPTLCWCTQISLAFSVISSDMNLLFPNLKSCSCWILQGSLWRLVSPGRIPHRYVTWMIMRLLCFLVACRDVTALMGLQGKHTTDRIIKAIWLPFTFLTVMSESDWIKLLSV